MECQFINIAKTEYLVLNSADKLTWDFYCWKKKHIKQVNQFKYLGTTVTKEETGNADIKYTVSEQERKIEESLNSIFWDKSI